MELTLRVKELILYVLHKLIEYYCIVAFILFNIDHELVKTIYGICELISLQKFFDLFFEIHPFSAIIELDVLSAVHELLQKKVNFLRIYTIFKLSVTVGYIDFNLGSSGSDFLIVIWFKIIFAQKVLIFLGGF